MPIARFEMPDGRVGRFEVPEGTTPEQAQVMIAESLQLPAIPKGGALEAVAESAATIGSGMIAEPLAGLAGVVQSVNPFADQGAGARSVESTREALTYTPKTEAGQKGLKTVGDLVKTGIDIANVPISGLAGLAELLTGQGVQQAAETVRSVQDAGLSQTMGERTMEETGSPLAASIAQTIPTAVMAATGYKPAVKTLEGATKLLTKPAAIIEQSTGLPTKAFQSALKSQGIMYENVADDIARLPPNIKPKAAVQQLIARKIKAGDTDDFLAGSRLDDAGRVVEDTLAKEAIKQGFREGDIQAIKAASPGTKQKMADMLDIRRKTFTNERLGLDKRPSDIVGSSALNRIDFIRNEANKARLELDGIAKTKLAGKPINSEAVKNSFLAELDRMDVDVDMSQGVPKLNFQGSMISKDRTSQKVIKDVLDLLAEPKAVDALRAHKLKRQLDAMIDFRKKSAGGLTETGRNVAKSVRSELNNAIREVDPDYARVNDVLSQSLGAMDDFEKVLGPSIDLWDAGAAKAIGQDLRGLLSNRKTRVRLEGALSEIDDVARDLGGVFDDDIRDLVLFDKTLNDQFGAVARSSFAGEVESGVKRAAQGTRGITDIAVDLLAEKAEKMRNINDSQAFRALDAIIRRDLTSPAKSSPRMP